MIFFIKKDRTMDNKQKVLIIITTEFVSYGGLTTVMMNYYRKINSNQLVIDFASTNKNVDCALLNELNEKGSQYFWLGNRKKSTLAYMYKLYELLKKNRYDVVHINSNSATAAIELFIAKTCKVRNRIVHNHTSRCNHAIAHKLLAPFFSRLYTTAIACSKKAGDWIFTNKEYMILNNGVDTERYRFNYINRAEIRKEFGISEDCFLLGHVGKIYEPKNHPFLIQIFTEYHKKNDKAKLLLVGDGEMRKQIEIQVNHSGISEAVIFAGMQSQVEKFLSAIDVFVFPSIWEGMPLSVIEAQASGVKCIISSNIDNSVAVTNNITFLPIDDGVSVWVDEIDKSMNNMNSDRQTQSNINIEMIRNAGYDTEVSVNNLVQVYTKGGGL